MIFPKDAYCQHRSDIWMLGYADPTPDTMGGIKFINNAPEAFTLVREMSFFDTNASICDTNGNILFYTNGQWIANAKNQHLKNGNNFNPGYASDTFYVNNGTMIGLGFIQGVLILPHPGKTTLYDLFYVTCEPIASHGQGACEALHLSYSQVDMSLDGKKGAVLTNKKNLFLIQDTLVKGRLTACKHANGRDWWLISHEFYSDRYYKFLITPDSIYGPFEQRIGSVITHDVFGSAAFSGDGSRYAQISPYDNTLDILDFDRCSGMFSNCKTLFYPDSDGGWWAGCEFSPNGRFVYACSPLKIWQVDLVNNYEMLTVASWDTVYAPLQTWFLNMGLGPDNRIYVGTKNGSTVFHVINEPDQKGVGCEVLQDKIAVPFPNVFTIPNFAHYELGALRGSPCDTVNHYPIDPNGGIVVYPNPTNGMVYLNGSDLHGASVSVFDVLGRLVGTYQMPNSLSASLDLNDIAAGVYLIQIQSSLFRSVYKVVKN